MKVVVDFYDYIYFGLSNSLFEKSEKVEKITSTLVVMTAIEWLYIFDFIIFYCRNMEVVLDWAMFRPRVYIVAFIVGAFNMAYMYSRHDLVQKKFINNDIDWIEKYSFWVLLFYAVPVIGFIYLLISHGPGEV